MNQIEKELAKLMVDNKYKLPIQKGDTGVQVVDIPNATSNCYSLLEKHCIEFNKWCFNNYCYDYDLNQWRDYGKEEIPYTTEQLFKLYIKQL